MVTSYDYGTTGVWSFLPMAPELETDVVTTIPNDVVGANAEGLVRIRLSVAR